jgi:hypothetical protein
LYDSSGKKVSRLYFLALSYTEGRIKDEAPVVQENLHKLLHKRVFKNFTVPVLFPLFKPDINSLNTTEKSYKTGNYDCHSKTIKSFISLTQIYSSIQG